MDEATLVTAITTIAGVLWGLYQQHQKSQVINYFDPDSTVTTPPSGVPKRSYVMSDSVKSFLLKGESLADQAAMTKQIDEAEDAGKWRYQIDYSKGYYIIEWGQISGGGKGE